MRWLQRLMGRNEFRESASAAVRVELPEIAGAFRFEVDDVVEIAGRGTVAIGTVLQGTARVGDAVEVRGTSMRIDAIEALGRPIVVTHRGEAIGLVLGGAGAVVRGDVVAGS